MKELFFSVESERLLKEFEERCINYIEDLFPQMNRGEAAAIVANLAGFDSERAWKMRERLLEEDMNEGQVAASLAEDYITFVWRLCSKKDM